MMAEIPGSLSVTSDGIPGSRFQPVLALAAVTIGEWTSELKMSLTILLPFK